jgi:hypothetical protein
MDTISPIDHVTGHVRGYKVTPAKCRTAVSRSPYDTDHREMPTFSGMWLPQGPWQKNAVLYDWGTIVNRLLRNSPDGKQYQIGGMYIEFDNAGSPVSLPSIARTGNKANYYDGLTGTQDYLRVPLVATTESSSNATNFPQGNIATFFAQTEGAVGESQGLTFSDVAGSAVFGIALVVFPEFADPSQDLVFSRSYFLSANQIDKVAGSQIGVTWAVTLD